MVFELNLKEKMNEFLDNTRKKIETQSCTFNVSSNCIEPQFNITLNENDSKSLTLESLFLSVSNSTSNEVSRLRHRRGTLL